MLLVSHSFALPIFIFSQTQPQGSSTLQSSKRYITYLAQSGLNSQSKTRFNRLINKMPAICSLYIINKSGGLIYYKVHIEIFLPIQTDFVMILFKFAQFFIDMLLMCLETKFVLGLWICGTYGYE